MKHLTKEIKIALTAFVAIALLFYGINFLKGINIFKSNRTYHVAFENIAGLAASSAVYADGFSIGTVRSIDYDYAHPGRIIVQIEVNKEMNIPKGTTAELESEMLGGVKMNLIIKKNEASFLTPGDTLTGSIHSGALGQAANLLPAVEALLPKLDTILLALQTLLTDPALAATLHNTEAITANLQETTTQLNGFLSKDLPHLTGKLAAIGTNVETITGKLAAVDVEGTMRSVNGTLSNVEQFTGTLNAKLSSTDNTLGLMLNDRRLYDNLNATFVSSDSLLTDLKAHPKRYVHFSIFGKKN